MKNSGNFLTEGPVGKALFIVALPIIISNLLQSVLEVVDMYFIGKLGDVSIAGGTMSIMVLMVLTTVIFGIVTATAAFVSRAYGSEKYERIQVILLHSLYLALGFSAILAVIGLFFSENLLLLMGAYPDVAAEGARFLTPMLMGLFVMVILITLTTVFQSTGDSRTPMYVMLGVNVVNIALNPTLIMGLGGLPAFGIAGSAYASLTSRAIGVLLLIGVMYLLPSRKNSPIRFPKKWTFEPKLIRDIVVIAIPSAVQSGIRSVAFLSMTTIIAVYGTAAVAAYGICLRLDMMGLIIVMGLCTGVAVMVGQNLGAGKVERAVQAVRYAAAINAAFMIGVAALYLVFATEFLKFFGATGESLADGILFMQIVPLSYFLIAIAMTMGFAMNGAGMTRPGMYSAIAGQMIVQVGLSAFFALSGYPIQYIWYAAVCGTVVMFCFDLFFYMRGGWKTKKLRIEGEGAPAEN
ncbi:MULTISPECIES: MATE family efflux transporter [Methanocorpusculum]|uniref:Multidrug-efflux transporter n=1 Tax=bioreactor metagenome TaxID=1076179 RepID=A0A644UFY7_9ZZZZ|nr:MULTISPECIES: MATE family efflux transporter [Methanocorpusculum]MDD4424268.1 MATE family efflux transporter [Methanocorpusculum parvum]MDD3047422.1 MATE family efflux transporter [Methanocorpusculum sp.]MDD3912984.1 MATE family efflux transporter [Methanocorpusculum sp.]MEA5087024.1 MATE family efflux transporter [Methanocorpusculum sp.]HJJ35364.1 MATE family efflux transporter [Methanocorpusculum sp.]